MNFERLFSPLQQKDYYMGLLSMFKKKKYKRVMIGLDGVPLPMIRGLTSSGIMPCLGAIIEHASVTPMHSSVPHISSVAWSSLITGKNPGEHGIYGFMELDPDNYEFYFPDSHSRKAPSFWEEEPDRFSVIVNVPSTYPAQSMNGVLIAGFVAVDLEKAVFPASLLPVLRDFDYRTDIDSSKGHESLDGFMEDAFATLEARKKTYRFLWKEQPWDTFMFTVTGTDRLCHFLYRAFKNTDHPFRDGFMEYFGRVDEIIGEIYDRTPEEALFMMFSDHGFGPLDREVYLNRVFRDRGFLRLTADTPSSFADIDTGTKAFVLDPSRVYVHTRSHYPRGEVSDDDYESVLTDIEQMCAELEIDGSRVIQTAHRKEEIFSGPCMDAAPDLVLIENEGFDLKARLSANTISGTSVFTGKHTPDDAFLLVRPPQGKTADIPDNVRVSDVRRIMG